MSKRNFKGSVVLNPVPVVLITSKNKDEKVNVFTVAWAGTICTKPPMLSISVRPERLSYEYIKESGEFVVNLPTASMTKAVDYCGVRSGRTVDKISEMNFNLEYNDIIGVPSIKECPVNIQCKVRDIIPLGTHDLILADVVGSTIDEAIIDEKGKIHFEKGNLISYSHGEYYPLVKKAIGSFGYSVRKKTSTKEDEKNKINKKNKKTKVKYKNKKANKSV
ncbi:flavin reductase family protein [Clostridium frigidicarnis]|uniref:NADH-FMN oxidoreductase RutF, flavin reductase (DIM6/NTAB) family n=1 Tax=Clostridium frigidicarnis TaxID=84698 RepID=A0A1I0XX01_9CLOT|nr:flavin reductase family protein [Clostridium frigidicarnis]SFB05177.1 NADH-FMN oxidoreductase RutF, flavin reductase (DIM6/NTAB) family [Clostridium frigidicarnis]